MIQNFQHNRQSSFQTSFQSFQNSFVSDKKSPKVSILPISNQDVLIPQLEHSNVSEFHPQDYNEKEQLMKGLSGCKLKFVKISKQSKETQTDPDDRDVLIQRLQNEIDQLKQTKLEFSFHKQIQQENHPPVPLQNGNKYFEVIQNKKMLILKPQNTEYQEYIKQKSNKDYFFQQN